MALLVSLAGLYESDLTGDFYREGSDPACSFEHDGKVSRIPIDRCCLRASQKLSCTDRDDRVCTDSGERVYNLTSDAVDYCQARGFGIE